MLSEIIEESISTSTSTEMDSETPKSLANIVNAPSTMKAAFYCHEGSSSVIKIGQVALPIALKNQVIVQVLASSVNPIDVKLRSLHISLFNRPLPKTIGCDFCGIVVDITACDDPHVNVGDITYGLIDYMFSSNGTCCEYIAVDEDHLAIAPMRKTFPYFTEAEISSLPLAGLTVLQAFEPFVEHCKEKLQEKEKEKEKRKTHQMAPTTPVNSMCSDDAVEDTLSPLPETGVGVGSQTQSQSQGRTRSNSYTNINLTKSALEALPPRPESSFYDGQSKTSSGAGDIFSDIGSDATDIGFGARSNSAIVSASANANANASASASASASSKAKAHPMYYSLPYASNISPAAALGTIGKTVLIQGGAGGLGTIAIQYCKHYLKMRVITTCSSKNFRFCRKLGKHTICHALSRFTVSFYLNSIDCQLITNFPRFFFMTP
jgi:NADPH:quinone reductase-like Zn-dependent oxidoreductase